MGLNASHRIPNVLVLESLSAPPAATSVVTVYSFGLVVDHSVGWSTRRSTESVAPPAGTDTLAEVARATTAPLGSLTV